MFCGFNRYSVLAVYVHTNILLDFLLDYTTRTLDYIVDFRSIALLHIEEWKRYETVSCAENVLNNYILKKSCDHL